MDITWPVKNLSHKQLIAIPLALAAVFAAAIVIHWDKTGTPVPLGMDFSGGTYASIRGIENVPSSPAVERALKDRLGGKFYVTTTENSIEIETSLHLSGTQENTIENILSNQFGVEDNCESDPMGSILIDLYKTQAWQAAVGAVIAMAIILFITLRHFTTVGGILTVMGFDLLGIFGGMVILDVPLSLASMAGILLILGYGVNTNILLCTRVLKRVGGTPRDRAADAMRTGITMSTTSAAAVIALNIVATAPPLELISAAIAIGIIIDMVNTWFLNSSMVTRHAEKIGREYRGRI